MKNISLRYKLFCIFIMIIIFFAVCTTFFVKVYIKNMMNTHFIDMGNVLTSTVSSNIANDLLAENFIEIYTFFEHIIKNNPDVSYLFIENNGNVLLHTFNGEFPKELLHIGHQKDTLNYVIVTTNNDTFYDFSTPIITGQTSILRLGMSGKMIKEMSENTIKTIGYVAFSAVVVALIFSIILSNMITKPLSLLTKSAAEVSEGNFSISLPLYGNDEVGRLSRAFHKMETAVRTRENELRDINEELETVNVRLHEYIEELNKTKEELIRSKQDKAMVETKGALLHHMRQPLTYLIMAIELATDELQRSGEIDRSDLIKKLKTVDDAGLRLAELFIKFEKLRDYKTVEFSDKTKIIDIGE